MLDNGAAIVGTINTSIGIVSSQLVFRDTVSLGTHRRICKELPKLVKFNSSVPLS